MLPDTVVPTLEEHLRDDRYVHHDDMADGFGNVYLPDALASKYPNAQWEWIWHATGACFPAQSDPRTRARVSSAGIISTRGRCRRQSSAQ